MVESIYTPAAALPLLSISNTKKFERDQNLYSQGRSKSTINVDRFKIDRKPFSIKFDAILDCDRILVNQFDGKSSYSLYVIPENEDDALAFEKFNDLLTSTFSVDDWDLTSSWKDDRLHLKLKYTPGSLQAFTQSNIPLNLKKPHDFKIHHGQKVIVTGSLSYYYNFESQMIGTTFNLSALEFET